MAGLAFKAVLTALEQDRILHLPAHRFSVLQSIQLHRLVAEQRLLHHEPILFNDERVQLRWALYYEWENMMLYDVLAYQAHQVGWSSLLLFRSHYLVYMLSLQADVHVCTKAGSELASKAACSSASQHQSCRVMPSRTPQLFFKLRHDQAACRAPSTRSGRGTRHPRRAGRLHTLTLIRWCWDSS